jgi:hypothetical protein
MGVDLEVRVDCTGSSWSELQEKAPEGRSLREKVNHLDKQNSYEAARSHLLH